MLCLARKTTRNCTGSGCAFAAFFFGVSSETCPEVLWVGPQVSDLEEERRKLRLEVKFRAKYHGKAALEMGLSPEQLLLLEEYVEGLKGGRHPEERLVTQLQQRVRVFLLAM
jgi:hypothetical protein